MSVLKLIMLGNTNVGKTCLCIKKSKGHFNELNESTIGAAYFNCLIKDDDNSYKIQIWDTAGQEKYRALVPLYYRNASAAIVLYDVTNEVSFNDAKYWIEELQNINCVIYLVGNKCDLLNNEKSNAVNITDYIENNKHIINHKYTSAKTGENIDELFLEIVRKIDKNYNNHSIKQNIKQNIKENIRHNKCC